MAESRCPCVADLHAVVVNDEGRLRVYPSLNDVKKHAPGCPACHEKLVLLIAMEEGHQLTGSLATARRLLATSANRTLPRSTTRGIRGKGGGPQSEGLRQLGGVLLHARAHPQRSAIVSGRTRSDVAK